MAWLAIETGDIGRAERWAEEAIRVPDVVAAPSMERGSDADVWAVERGHIVLGRIALGRGDIHEAEHRLSLAVTARLGSDDVLVWGDPDFSLAEGLLHEGRTEPVLRYLAACRGTWIYADQLIGRWIRAIEGGTVPHLQPWRSSKPSLRLTLRALGTALRAWKGPLERRR